MQAPRFSIVITCYRQREFIRAAVDSALSQNNRSMETIVVDDGSDDGSAELLDSYAASLQLVKMPDNRGAIAARNLGASLAKGQYLVFLDGDDVLMPWALDVYARLIEERQPGYILARTWWFANGPVPALKSTDVPGEVEFVQYESVLHKDRPAGLSASAFVIERAAFEAVGGWTPGIFHLDLQDIMTKLSCVGPVILILAPCTVFYRVHPGNSIHAVPPFLSKLHLLLAKERAGEYPGGDGLRFRRRAWLGGLVLFWLKRSLSAGLFRDALKLAATGWPMVLAWLFTRSAALIRGRRPIARLSLQLPGLPDLVDMAGAGRFPGERG